MRFAFPSRAKVKPLLSLARKGSGLPDAVWTSLHALKESADAFPPLKSVVGGVIAICEVAERARHSKSNALSIARRANEILDMIADALPDGSVIPSPMLLSIEKFTVLLAEIHGDMKLLAATGRVSRAIHLNRNERMLEDIKVRLDDAYRDFLAASTMRLEVEQSCTRMIVDKVAADTNTMGLRVTETLIYSRLNVFLARP